MPKILKFFFFFFFYLFFFVLSVKAEAGVLFFDDFNDGDINGWTVESGNWSVDNGNLLTQENGVLDFLGQINAAPADWDNYRIEFDVNTENGVDNAIQFRKQGNNSYIFNIRHDSLPSIKLFKIENNVALNAAQNWNLILQNRVWYHIKIEAIDENIKIWINDNLALEYNDPGTNLRQGGIGLQSWTGWNGYIKIRFDNIKVTSLVPTSIKTPLILIPGIGGSELKVNEDTIWNKDDGHGGIFNHAYPKDDVVWLNEPEARAIGEDDYFDILRMKSDGINSEANLSITDNLLARVYQNTIDFFISNGYTLNTDFFIFPYDWRKDNTQSTDLLHQKIEAVKAQTGSPKVDIVTHSMGGLVARYYITDSARAQNIRKLFTLGTPHLGTPELLKGLRYGLCLKYPFGPFCLSLAPSEMRDVLQNMISAFQLAPSQSYSTFYSGEDSQHPYPYLIESGQLDYSQIKNLLTNFGHNTSLFTPSEAFHSIDTNLSNTNGVEVVIIAGSGQATLGQIIEKKTTNLLGTQITHKDMLNINGDETVPLFSASLEDPEKNRSLLGPAKLYYTNQTHGSLVSDGPALNLVKNLLDENSDLPLGVSTTAYKFSGQGLSVHSPVNIHTFDSSGNHTGPTSDGFEQNIPGSSYESLDDAKFVWLPEDGQYTIKFEATNQGSFDFKIREYESNINTRTTQYENVPLTPSTQAQTDLDTNSAQPPILQIDQDGDGTIDIQASPSAILTQDQINDQTPPQTIVKLTGKKGQNNWFTANVAVELNVGNEAIGSGVLQTEYTINNQDVQTYSAPFTISNKGITKLKFRSIDNAGNEETPQEIEIKIDKTAPEAKILVDENTKDLIVLGIDTNPTAVERSENIGTKRKDDYVYKITDEAGNALNLNVIETDKPNKDKFRITSLQYNNKHIKTPTMNQFNVAFQFIKKQITFKNQEINLEGEVNITIQYDPKKDESTIIVTKPKKKVIKEVRSGIVLLQLKTNKGKLEASY